MKVPDSGMPEEAYWNSLFNIPAIVDWLDLKHIAGPVVEIGCGYGAFTVPVAKETPFMVHAFDIEPSMIERAEEHIRREGIENARFHLKDVVDHGTALEPESAGLVLLFNILHFDERRVLLEEAARILNRGGRIAITHWRKDIETPRGPEIKSRPDKGMILNSIEGLDLRFDSDCRIIEPYHWGMKLVKGKKS